jgi:hypothetical protein
MKLLLQSDSGQRTADSGPRRPLLSAVRCLLSVPCLLSLLACASTPPPAPPSLQIALNGQVIDRQFREIVVTIVNDGTTPLYGFPVEVDIPPSLAIIRESHEGALDLRGTDAGTYHYVVSRLDPGAHVVARFPFRRESSAALAAADVRVVAAGIESRRTFSE